jgi:hypothetical protein
MGTVTTTDGAETSYKHWGTRQPIVFSHGSPLSADDWDTQMLFLLLHGYRVVAHDRRRHGRPTRTSDGRDIDHNADDLAALVPHLDLHDAIHVGDSTGGGVAHYLAPQGEDRVATNRPVFYGDLRSTAFYHFNRPRCNRSGVRCKLVAPGNDGRRQRALQRPRRLLSNGLHRHEPHPRDMLDGAGPPVRPRQQRLQGAQGVHVNSTSTARRCTRAQYWSPTTRSRRSRGSARRSERTCTRCSRPG